MAFRGRGQGRGGSFGGRGPGEYRHAKPVPFVLFPEIELPDKNDVPEEKGLAVYNYKFRTFFRSSPYYLEEKCSGEETVDIERYCDIVNPKGRNGRESLTGSGFLKLEPGYFPLELVRGTKYRSKRKAPWNPKGGLKKLDFLEDLEKKFEDGNTNDKKEKDSDGDEEEEDEEVDEEDDKVESDDDYAQGEFVDDDEDDYNIVDNGEEEATM